MNKYRCKLCPYVYDPAENDGVSFELLPEDWTCPTCGVGKSEFEIVHQLGEEYTGGEAQEKHVPIFERNGTIVTVTVGAVLHPMEEVHHIIAIEIYDGDKLLQKKELSIGEEPVAIFENIAEGAKLKALAHCNLHGIWES